MSLNIGDLLGSLTGGGNDDSQSGDGDGGGNMLQSMLPALMGLMQNGGLQKILGGLNANGLTSTVDTWTAGGENQKISAADVEAAVPKEQLQQVAQQANVSEEEAASGLSQLLPGLVDKPSSGGGHLPESNDVAGMLGSLTKQLGM
jgi:uncharacterized protein YidB (DUF937 family)